MNIALQVAGRGADGFIRLDGGWARDHLNARGGHGSLTADGCYFLADLVGAHAGAEPERKTTHPCRIPPEYCQRPRGVVPAACRIAKRRIRGGRGITDQLAGGPSEAWRLTSQVGDTP